MDIDKYRIQATLINAEAGLVRPIQVTLPSHHTIEPRIHNTTPSVAALDGTDQQIFYRRNNPDQGIAAWGVLYVELDPKHPNEGIYREGPASGLLANEDLFYYHLTMDFFNPEKNRHFRNDSYAIRQTLSSARPIEPPLFKNKGQKIIGVRPIAAVERATGEWLSLRAALTHQLPRGSLVLKDGRFNCQIEQAASWVDELGRSAARNGVRCVAVVKSGAVYDSLSTTVETIAEKTDRAFYFIIPEDIIEQSYENNVYTNRKTLMVGGKDHTDLAGIGALWVAFCPDPINFRNFVILEFNLYDLHFYKKLAYEPETLLQWQHKLKGKVGLTEAKLHCKKGKNNPHVYVTDLLIDQKDIDNLVIPTLEELLWLCELEVARFGYPNLLGIAHHEVILTTEKVNLLRQRYREVFDASDRVSSELFDKPLDITSHKLHNIH